MNKFLPTFLSTLLPCMLLAAPPPKNTVWITLSQPAWTQLQRINPGLHSLDVASVDSGLRLEGRAVLDSIHVLEVSLGERAALARAVHQKLHHCAGFVAYDSMAAALSSLQQASMLTMLPLWQA